MSTTSEAASLATEGHTTDGDQLISITTKEGVSYWFARRNQTTLELREIDDADGNSVGSEVVAGVVYEDLPDEVRRVLKVEGFRMVARDGFLAGVINR